MTPFETYRTYNAIHLHFNKRSYDYFKHDGRSKFNHISYEKCKGKYFYGKLGEAFPSKSKFVDFLVANYVSKTPPTFIADLVMDDCNDIYKEWQRRNQSLYHLFYNDCLTIHDYCVQSGLSYKDIFIEYNGKLPSIFALSNNGNISKETLVIINKLTNFTKKRNFINPLSLRNKLAVLKYDKFIQPSPIDIYGKAFVEQIIGETND